jgi:hypothetical protein
MTHEQNMKHVEFTFVATFEAYRPYHKQILQGITKGGAT